MSVYVGFEGFVLKRMYIIKEMTVLYESGNLDHYRFAAPTTVRLTTDEAKTVRYASRHLNGLSYHDGEISYEEIYSILGKLAGLLINNVNTNPLPSRQDITSIFAGCKIYVHGSAATNFILQHLPNSLIVNTAAINILPTELIRRDCGRDHPPRYCSMAKAFEIKKMASTC